MQLIDKLHDINSHSGWTINYQWPRVPRTSDLYLQVRNIIFPFLHILATRFFKLVAGIWKKGKIIKEIGPSEILISRGTDSRLNDGPVISMFLRKFKIICLTMFWKWLSLMFEFNIMLTSTISYFSVAIDVDSYCVVIT